MQLGYVIGIDLDIPIWVILIVINLIVYYVYMTWPYDYFKKHGIAGPKPVLVFGNILSWMRNGLIPTEMENSKKYGKIYGIYLFRMPSLTITDPELIKKVLVKDFHYFINRKVETFTQKDSLLSKVLTNLRDDHWKHIRKELTPTFSAAKLKLVQKQINQCADQLVAHIRRTHDKDEAFECKEFASCYAMDVIAFTTYGIQLDSQNDPNNIFIQNNKKILRLTLSSPKYMLLFFFPFLKRFFLRFFPIIDPTLESFYTKVSNDVLELRSKQKGERSDFVQLMVDALTEQPTALNPDDNDIKINDSGELWTEKGLTKQEIAANSLLFLFGGYDNVSSGISFAIYCLAVNPDCQERLIREIDETIGQNEPTYQDMAGMSYLQQVIDETLRLYPPTPRIEREVHEDITIDGIYFKKGTQVGCPIIAMHMDPNIWPEPEKFDPERFTNEAKESRNPCYYMPFGMGPRNCIGMRLALLEMKLGIVKILQNFRLVPCEKTQIPPKLEKIRVVAEGGIWIKAKSREDML